MYTATAVLGLHTGLNPAATATATAIAPQNRSNNNKIADFAYIDFFCRNQSFSTVRKHRLPILIHPIVVPLLVLVPNAPNCALTGKSKFAVLGLCTQPQKYSAYVQDSPLQPPSISSGVLPAFRSFEKAVVVLGLHGPNLAAATPQIADSNQSLLSSPLHAAGYFAWCLPSPLPCLRLFCLAPSVFGNIHEVQSLCNSAHWSPVACSRSLERSLIPVALS